MTQNLDVFVVGAVNLNLTSETGYTEPLCTVQVGTLRSSISASKKQEKKIKNRNPVIKKAILFENIDLSKEILKIEFWDFDDDLNKKVNIGSASLPLNKVHSGKGETFSLKLSDDSYVTILITPKETSKFVENSKEKDQMPIIEQHAPKLEGYKAPKLEKYDAPELEQYDPPKFGEYKAPKLESYKAPKLENHNASYSSDPNKPKVESQNVPKTPSEEQKPVLYFYKPKYIKRDFPPLAQGSYGTVFTGYVEGTKEKVVIKDMNIRDHKTIDEWKKEINAMNKTRSPYVVNIIGYSSNNNVLSIIMEYIAKGSLYDMIHKKRKKLSIVQKMRMARHCALGLEFLHGSGIIHRDIKSMNILVGEDYSCKITDFGTAKFVSKSHQNYHTVNSGTPLWMAPEVRYSNVYDYSADIYSLGLVFYELFEGKLPYYNQMTNSIELPKYFKSSNIVLICLNKNPKLRPTASVIITKINKMIDNILNLTRKILPAKDEEFIQEELKRLNIEKEDTSAENLVLYKYLLGKNPVEVDALVDKAFGVVPEQQPQIIKQQKNQQPEYQIKVKPVTQPNYSQPIPQQHHFQKPQYGYPPQYPYGGFHPM